MKKTLTVLLLTGLFISACTAANNSPTPTPTPIPSPSATAEPGEVIDSEVVLVTPDENATVVSPLQVEGLAPGTWFFEGNIVGEIRSQSGETLTTFPLQAQGEWMTEESVRFEGEATFTPPEGDERIELIIKNDNPSGLPENEKSQSFTLLLEQ